MAAAAAAAAVQGWRALSQEVWVRGQWLMGLLVLQSTSSFVLEANEGLIRDHLVITLFLTMLVGAGGNAGNQSAIQVIRGLATKEMEVRSVFFRIIRGTPRNVLHTLA
jgi:Mg/Co/Ni transporter MgtE